MIIIPDVTVEGKVGVPTEVGFKGYANEPCVIKVRPSCGCTSGKADYKVDGDFSFTVTLDSRKYPQKVEKTVTVYASQDGIPMEQVKVKFKVNIA